MRTPFKQHNTHKLGHLQHLPNLHKLNKQHVISLCVASAIGSASAFAEVRTEKYSDIEMIEVIGQATSGLDRLITADDLQNLHADSLSDVFRQDPSVSAGGSIGMGQKIYMRNIGEDLLNISIDGAEQSGAVFHHAGRIVIEPELLKQVEIEAGTGSATAGSGALGGSIKLTTKDPDDLLAKDENFGALIKSSYFSNGDGFKNSVTVFGRDTNDVFSAMASVVASDFDNVEDADGTEIIGTGSEQTLGYAKIVANLSEHQFLSLSHEGLKEDGDILYRPEWIASRGNAAEPTEGERKTTTLNYGLNDTNNDLLDFSVNVYNTKNYQSREFRTSFYDGAVKSKGATIQNISIVGQHQLIYGLNFRDDTSYLNDIDFAPDAYFEETGKIKGLYLQDVIDVSSALTVSAGMRFDNYQLSDINGLEFDESGVSPNLSANYALTNDLSISAGYAEAFRGPEVKDAFKLSIYSNDVSLEAETAKNLEFGLDYALGNASFAGGVYRSDIETPIAGNVPWSNVNINLDNDIETKGYYLEFAYQTSQLDFSAAINSADTELDGQVVTRYVYSSAAASSGDTLALNLHYEFNETINAGWSARMVKGIHDIKLNVGGEALTLDKPGYAEHDIYARWLPLGGDMLTVNLTLKNVFDKQYLHHGSVENFTNNAGYEVVVGAPEAGRDVRVSVALRF
jgi:hemoglobin/transferrin/lactoferrin receptor protein